MRILITKFPYNSLLGGGELHTLELVKSLSKKGFDFVLLSSDDILMNEFKKRAYPVKKMWAPLEPVSLKGLALFPFFAPFFLIYLFVNILSARSSNKQNVLFCLSYTEKVLFTPIARLLGMKVLWMEHLRIERSYIFNPLRVLYVFFSRWATVVTVSHSVGDQLEKLGIHAKNIKVIYNGVDTRRFLKVPRESNKPLIVGAMSRLVDEKGVDVLIKAFSKVSKKYPLKLHIAGSGPEKQKLLDLAKKEGVHDTVSFVGFANPVDFLSSIDVFSLTPRAKESFGYVAAEAMSMEIPVVGTALSGLSEVIVDGSTGYLCDVDDVECIAQRIESLVSDSKKRSLFGRDGRIRVQKKFSLDTMLFEYDSLFRKK